MPYALALALVSSLLPVTVVVLVDDYGVSGGIAGPLATAQVAPLLLAVSRPLQAWWVVFAADVLGALVTMDAGVVGAGRGLGRRWSWWVTWG